MNTEIKNLKLALFHGVFEKNSTESASLQDIMFDISQGKYKDLISDIRQSPDCSDLKKSLPLFCPSIHLKGTRALYAGSEYFSTGIVQFDVDNISENEISKLRKTLCNVPECLYAFRSPRNGFKFALLTDYQQSSNENALRLEFKRVYDHVKQYVGKFIACELDDSTSSISQACFVSHDPDAYFNLDASAYEVKRDVFVESIEERMKLEEQLLADFQDYQNIEDEDVRAALSFIPVDYSYDQRLKINFAVIDALGARAKEVLLNHWDHADSQKLEKQIDGHIKDFRETSSSVTVASLFHDAKKHGFEFKTYLSNRTGIPTKLKPTYDHKIYSIEDARKRLQDSVDEFFDQKQSKLINFEAGAGKTEQVISAVIDRLEKNRFQKIAIFVPTHALAEEMKERIRAQISERQNKKKSFKDQLQASGNIKIAHIKGKSWRGKDEDQLPPCQHPINLEKIRAYDENTEGGNDLFQFFDENPREFCRRCPLNDSCTYIGQFSDPMANIRIYTHNHLFNNPSTFDAGVIVSEQEKIEEYLDSDSLGRRWNPDYIIVDEDIIRASLDDEDLIEEISYAECSTLGKTGRLLKSLINEEENIKNGDTTFERVVMRYSSEIEKAASEQHFARLQWLSSFSISHDADNKEMIRQYRNKQASKPPYFEVLAELSKYVYYLKGQKNIDEHKYQRIFIDQAKLIYAQRHEIIESYQGKPTLLLDASANEKIASFVFGEEFKYECIRVAYQKNVKVYQFANCIFSKKQMNDAQFQEKIESFIIKRTKKKSFGIITYKNLKAQKNFSEKLASKTKAQKQGYFGNIRGLDSFNQLDALFVVGRQMITPDDLFLKYRQLFGSIKRSTEDLLLDRYMKEQVYRCADGKHRAVKNLEYVDFKLAQLNDFYNRSETYQAAHRLRLIHGDRNKELYIMTSEVLDFTVDELLNTRTDLGYTKNTTDERVNLIAKTTLDEKFLLDKNKILSEKTGLKASEISNLKIDKTYVQRILKADKRLSYFAVFGKDKSRRMTRRNIFKVKSEELSKTDLQNACNLASISKIEEIYFEAKS